MLKALEGGGGAIERNNAPTNSSGHARINTHTPVLSGRVAERGVGGKEENKGNGRNNEENKENAPNVAQSSVSSSFEKGTEDQLPLLSKAWAEQAQL